MHDDQHGTAIVVLAGLINASKVTKKRLDQMQVVIVGAGAAGRAIALLLIQAAVGNVIVTDSQGAIAEGRSGLSAYKRDLAKLTNRDRVTGDLLTVIKNADVVIGVSGPGTIATAHIEAMNDNPVVFALANPIPEIMPEDAKRAGAVICATGRSDLPNQINNSLAFPGIFRGALDRGVTAITDDMKIAAAKKIAGLVKNPTAQKIVPTNNEPGLVTAVASVIK